MILGFKPQFVESILSGVKIHTIREDELNRWKVGNKIHFATRVRTKKQKQFYEDVCVSVQNIRFILEKIYVDGKKLERKETLVLAKNDGFNNVGELFDFFDWKDFEGKIIHWTNYLY